MKLNNEQYVGIEHVDEYMFLFIQCINCTQFCI